MKPLSAIIFHVALGFLASINREWMRPVLIALLIYFTYKIIVSKDKQQQVLLACAYVAGAEVFFRMTKSYFFWEIGKYIILIYSMMGIYYSGFKRESIPYVLYFIFLLPGIIVSYVELTYDVEFRKSVLFNLSGPFCLSVASVFTYGRVISQNQMLKVLDYMVYPIITTVVYVVLYSPSIQEAIVNTASNSNISGGYSGNQVATVLGFGFFLLLIRVFIPYKNILVQGAMMFFMILMGYRALLTFSRGGVVVAVIISLLFIVIYRLNHFEEDKLKVGIRYAGLFIGALALWGFTQVQTSGLIENRYTNKDSLGREKEDFTTGRLTLLMAEWDAFTNNPIAGVGAGRIKIHFEEQLGVELPTHNEITRTLAEHGSFGIFALLTLIFAPIISLLQGRKNIFFWPFLAFWFFTIAHSSMRMALPAFVYALCLLNVKYDPEKKPAVRRKSIKKARPLSNIGRYHSA